MKFTLYNENQSINGAIKTGSSFAATGNTLAIGISTSAITTGSISFGQETYANGTTEPILVPVPIIVLSACTMSDTDPIYEGGNGKSIIFPGDVSAVWQEYLWNYCTITTLYGGTGSTYDFDCSTINDIYYDAVENKTYIIESTLDDLTFTQISGDTFYSSTEYIERPAYAEGYQTIASGMTAHAEGYLSSAYGVYSHAEGYNSNARGEGSHAEGYSSQALGQFSHAEGQTGWAIGQASHAEGIQTQAFGNFSHVEGYQTVASGTSAHAEGQSTKAHGDYSHSEGMFTQALGPFSHAEGYSTLASANSSHAEGYQTQATGVTSHAEGINSKANGYCCHAEGQGTIANGWYSHAQGYETQTEAFACFAGGLYSFASGHTSFAFGSGATAIGHSVVTLGDGISGTSNDTVYVSNLVITSQRKLFIATGGTHPSAGSVVLVGGTVTVNTNKVTASSMIMLTVNGVGVLANLGNIYEDRATRVAGTSFTIKSSNVLDTSTISWFIIEPSLV